MVLRNDDANGHPFQTGSSESLIWWPVFVSQSSDFKDANFGARFFLTLEKSVAKLSKEETTCSFLLIEKA
jgi:hypothetical protein